MGVPTVIYTHISMYYPRYVCLRHVCLAKYWKRVAETAHVCYIIYHYHLQRLGSYWS